MAGEVVAGILAHSLALLSDAAHMLTDAGAIGLSLFALRLAARPAAGAMTRPETRRDPLGTGQRRQPARARRPDRLRGDPPARLPARCVRLDGRHRRPRRCCGESARDLATCEGQPREHRGRGQHILTDVYAFIGTLIAGAVILTTGFHRADPLASLFETREQEAFMR